MMSDQLLEHPFSVSTEVRVIGMAEAMVTPRCKYRRPAMVTPTSYPYP